MPASPSQSQPAAEPVGLQPARRGHAVSPVLSRKGFIDVQNPEIQRRLRQHPISYPLIVELRVDLMVLVDRQIRPHAGGRNCAIKTVR
jgi:hypothetical protein